MTAFEAVGRGSIPRRGICDARSRMLLSSIVAPAFEGDRERNQFVLGVWWMHATLRRS
jgi:hypothetical protein